MPTMPTLQAGQLLTATAALPHPLLTLARDGTLATLTASPETNGADTTTLTPAFLDIHTHGAVGEDVMSATPAGFARLQRFFATRGVAWYLPTTVTAALDTTLHALDRIATQVESQIERGPQPLQAQPLGIHLEGPFLSPAKRGVHPAQHLLAPDIATFDRLQAAARGHILLLTLAPELPGALDLIRHAVSLGVRISLGHTNATAADTLAAVDAGATGATHTFNAMRPLDHREPGVLGITLDDPRLYAELIADTVHVAPPLVRLWHRAKGPSRAILVTDSMAATGSGEGSYTLGGLPVTVRHNRVLLTTDLARGTETLAGSILTLDTAVHNLQHGTGCPLAEAVRAATHTPAAFLGLPDLTAVAPGYPANLNRFDQHGKLLATYLHGEEVPRVERF